MAGPGTLGTMTDTLEPVSPEPAATGPAAVPAARPRPLIERIGMAAIALVMAGMFGIVAVASFAGGQPFLGAMGAAGCLMALWAGGITLLRG